MSEPNQKPPDNPEDKLKIYFLPNLLTAGNLFCGFVALTTIVDADPYSEHYFDQIKLALAFILLACIFDLLDGRVARMGGVESPFGREFDSLADLISFGVAPAFLVQRVVLADVFGQYKQISWFIASIYLLCGAFRLARFNCLAIMGGSASKDFLGFPIPSAAGLVASLTLLIMHFNTNGKSLANWNYVIAAVLIVVSVMMVSTVRYPSFKSLGLRSTSTFAKAIGVAIFIGALFIFKEKILYYVLPSFFTLYLLYGFVRPSLSRAWRREIEEEDDEHETD
ncbi:MAG: CDP-diacylglycerol--serine O-phosphatidyltransferase [Limisphaerales bacterium]